jgi:hypothetical protein
MQVLGFGWEDETLPTSSLIAFLHALHPLVREFSFEQTAQFLVANHLLRPDQNLQRKRTPSILEIT